MLIDGQPVFRPQSGTDLQRIINTSSIVLKADSGELYLHLFDGWMEASSLQGPWKVSDPHFGRKDNLDKALKAILAAKNGDPMTGGSSDPKAEKPSLKNKPVPVVYMETQPTELIVVGGQPNYESIPGTNLLYLSNTTGRVFKDIQNQNTYVLIAGRWFSAPDTSGPWTFVPTSSLPADFAKIPDESPMENVKASVPGTPQAQASVIAASIPQTATVKRTAAAAPVTFDGTPQMKPVEYTSLQYVVNASTPILMTGPNSYFMCQSGIWFTSTAVAGPWVVAAWVPASIYTIPPSSPLYYLTYVQVYGSTPTVVYVGYTPGYTGAIVYNGVVVYGTGYSYSPWVGTVWYGPPVTYGYGVNMAYTPYTGWAFAFGIGCGFAMGAAMCGYGWGYYGWGWGACWGGYYGHYGAAAWGYGGGAVWGPGYARWSSGNVYSQWGSTSAVTRSGGGYNAWTGTAWHGQEGSFYNSKTGAEGVGQRGQAYNAYTGNYASGGRGAAYNPTTGASAAGGRVTVGNAVHRQPGHRGARHGHGRRRQHVLGRRRSMATRAASRRSTATPTPTTTATSTRTPAAAGRSTSAAAAAPGRGRRARNRRTSTAGATPEVDRRSAVERLQQQQLGQQGLGRRQCGRRRPLVGRRRRLGRPVRWLGRRRRRTAAVTGPARMTYDRPTNSIRSVSRKRGEAR